VPYILSTWSFEEANSANESFALLAVPTATKSQCRQSKKPQERQKDSPQRGSAPNWRHTRGVVSTKPGKKAKTHWRKCCAVLSPLIVLNDVRQIKLVPQYCHRWNLAEWATWSVITISAFRIRFAAIKANGRREIRHRTPRNSNSSSSSRQ